MRPWGRMDKARGESWCGQDLSRRAQSVGTVLQSFCLQPKGFWRVEAISKPRSLVFGNAHCWLAEPTLKWSIVIGQYLGDVSAGDWMRWRFVVVLAVGTGRRGGCVPLARGWWSCLLSGRGELGRWRIETELHVTLWILVNCCVGQLRMHDHFSLHLVLAEGIQPLFMATLQTQYITR